MLKFLKSKKTPESHLKNPAPDKPPTKNSKLPEKPKNDPKKRKPLPPTTSSNIIVTSVRRISNSSGSLHNYKQTKNDDKKTRRPVSSILDSYSASRRDKQSSKLDSQTPEDLSRASSISNLNAEQKSKGAKPKKSESRDRLDKLDSKKHDRSKAAVKNNNSSSNSQVDVEILQRQLSQMANEKTNLALQLGEQNGQLNALHTEISRLKILQDESKNKMEILVDENNVLRNRLRDVSHSPLSDTEKQQLLYESRHHSSAPASIATNPLDDIGDIPLSEWQKQHSSSQVSVACLQDKINQMQETHYSTNEELQATLQELTDLQRQLTELQQENLRLNEEKTLMFESLCRQTERLNDSRGEVESLKQLLYKDDAETASAEREQKLVELLKSAQSERENLLLNNEQLSGDLQEAQFLNQANDKEILNLTDRVKTLESTLDAKHAEHKLLDQRLAKAKDQSSSRQIEINRFKDLLENARTKIQDLEQDRALIDKSEVDELLDNARKEKDSLESEVAHLKEHLALSKNETEKFREQVSVLQEECKVVRNNAKTTQSDLEYKLDNVQAEKNNLSAQLLEFQDLVNELQVQSQCQADDKRQLSAVLSETQRNLNESERKVVALDNELEELKKIKQEQEDEWEKFQNDLLTSVRVANDFKTEAQQDVQKLILENKAGRDRIKQLESQIEKMRATNESIPIRPTTFQVEDLAAKRQKMSLSRQNSRQSVKSLIESIENNGKPITKSVSLNSVSRSSSTSSVNSLMSDLKTPSSPLTPGSPLKAPEWAPEGIKTPLKEQQPNKINCRDWGKNTDNKDLVKSKTESILHKGIDFTRRNSYSDLSERNDPLNGLVKNGGSKRNALLKWCQNKTVGYRNIDITNFSSSWNDGLALCALLHTYLPERIPYDSLTPQEKRRNFSLAFAAAESVGIVTTLNINDMIQLERPDWQQVMSYVTALYKHFET